jgi:hypothetical protein
MRAPVRAKNRQVSKLAEIRAALIGAGFDTTEKQATALGLGRSTAWNVLNRDTRADPSAAVVKRILLSPKLPTSVRRKIEEYLRQKSRGLYGHSQRRSEAFSDQFPELT